jgi:hypothetical protein
MKNKKYFYDPLYDPGDKHPIKKDPIIMKKKKKLSSEQEIRMIEEWETKTIKEWADEFEISSSKLSSIASIIHQKNPKLCPPKKI